MTKPQGKIIDKMSLALIKQFNLFPIITLYLNNSTCIVWFCIYIFTVNECRITNTTSYTTYNTITRYAVTT